ncbi:MAG: hypothetical protein WC061_09680 [Melioribacteraceae bacterium]
MKRVLATLFVLLFLFNLCFAQINPGARQIALAHSNISASDDVFALFNNPAGLALIQYREVGLFYSPAPYGIKELSTAFASYCEPTAAGSFGAGFSIYGFDLYKETNIAVGFGKKIAENLSLGITSVYQNISIRNYGSKGIVLFNFGGSIKLGSKIGIGFTAQNITRESIADGSNQKPTLFWLGTDLRFVKEISFTAAIQKEIGFNPSFRLGVEYAITGFLILRGGVSDEPDTYCGGIGVLAGIIQFDYAITSHNYLGLTHQFGLIIHFTR